MKCLLELFPFGQKVPGRPDAVANSGKDMLRMSQQLTKLLKRSPAVSGRRSNDLNVFKTLRSTMTAMTTRAGVRRLADPGSMTFRTSAEVEITVLTQPSHVSSTSSSEQIAQTLRAWLS